MGSNGTVKNATMILGNFITIKCLVIPFAQEFGPAEPCTSCPESSSPLWRKQIFKYCDKQTMPNFYGKIHVFNLHPISAWYGLYQQSMAAKKLIT